MKAKIYSNQKLIGTSELRIVDESMGVVSGKFLPNENYEEVRKVIWNFHSSHSDRKFEALDRLRLNCQLGNNVFLYPLGGFLITDIEELPNEDLVFEAMGNYRHVLEDNFLADPPKERLLEPWESITIEQKIAYEDELFKEIGKAKGILRFFKPTSHQLRAYEFSAMAKLGTNDDVLFAVHKKGDNEFDYAVIHLTWIGKLEKNDNFPRASFFKDFDHFIKDRLHPDRRDWEE
ncbi:MAG: hypothetical protein AAF985_17540 [Bacteroidota bacterium]